jgi:peptidoglycan/LPS O-acetylase OafA/YrhL
MSDARPSAAPRRQGVELIRLMAACGVVLIHFWPRQGASPFPMLDALVVGTSRFAVPFFFAASAYFLRDRLESFADGWRFARKWIRVLVLWHVVHAVWFTALHVARTSDPFHHIPVWLEYLASWNALFEGVAWPLWYLHSLVFCVLLASALPRRWRSRLLLPLGATLYAAALLWGSWSHLAPTWMPPTPFYINPRGFLFSALLPFALGLCIANPPRRPLAFALVLVGLLVQTTEILWIPPAPPGLPHEYYLGSALLGPALLWLGLDWAPRWSGDIAWGAASLPMYLLQLIVFSVLCRGFEWPLARLLDSGWASGVGAICIALPLYAWACHHVSRNNLWRKFHA